MPHLLRSRSSLSLRLALAVALTLVSGAAGAGPRTAIPRTIPYKGLLDQAGAPVNRTVSMSFALYPTATSTTALWRSNLSSVPVQQGAFSVSLGGAEVAPAIPEAVFEAGEVFLEIAIDNVALVGRQRIGTAPYAVRAQSADNGVPPGSIMAFGGEGVPQGWARCDGTEVATTTYPELCAALGAAWGPAAAGTCRLPDLRGQFLRGAHGPAVDPEGDRVVGDHQTGEVGPHNHRLGLGFPFVQNHPYAPIPPTGYWIPVGHNQPSGVDNAGYTGDTGGAESRPRNVAVQFIIKL